MSFTHICHHFPESNLKACPSAQQRKLLVLAVTVFIYVSFLFPSYANATKWNYYDYRYHDPQLREIRVSYFTSWGACVFWSWSVKKKVYLCTRIFFCYQLTLYYYAHTYTHIIYICVHTFTICILRTQATHLTDIRTTFVTKRSG